MAQLAQISRGTIAGLAPTPVETYAIDTYFVNDKLMNAMEFVPNGAAGTLGNIQVSYVEYSDAADSDADFRNIGEEYSSQAATPNPKVVQLKNLGGAYPVDRTTTRALKNGGIDVYREQQARQKANRIKNGFTKAFISGDTSKNAKSFDGVYAGVIKAHPEQENKTALAIGAQLTQDKAIAIELYMNKVIGLMNVTPNYVLTTRNGAAIAKTVNAMRNFGTQAVEVNDVKYNQFMGINIIDVDDSYFPADKLELGIPFIFVYIADDEKGIKTAIPQDGTVIDIVEPELGDGTLVKTGAMEMICTPYFANCKAVGIGYLNTGAEASSTSVVDEGAEG